MRHPPAVWFPLAVFIRHLGALALLLTFVLVPRLAVAVSIDGFMQYDYARSDTKITEANGRTIKSEGEDFAQTYNLFLSQYIMPNLRLEAGGYFQQTSTTVDLQGETASVKNSILRPRIGLALNTLPFFTRIEYLKTVEKRDPSGAPQQTNIREDYLAAFSWTPEGFPSLSLQAARADFYDKERVVNDVTDDTLNIGSQYRPIPDLYLNVNALLTDRKDRLNNTETKGQIYSGLATYTHDFYNRVYLNTSYNITNNITEYSAPVGGEISIQRTPFSGMSAVTDNVIQDTLPSNPLLIDGNLTVSAGVNIGLPPLIGGDMRPRNIGLDLFGNNTEVSQLFVWVDRGLPPAIVASFSWAVYVSSNNVDWSFHAVVFPASFGFLQNRFEIAFPKVKTRYIKVVVSPLSQNAAAQVPQFLNPDRIFVTELQAFLQSQATAPETTISSKFYVYNLNARVKIMDQPNINYEFYFLTSSDRTFLSNGVSLFSRFSPVLSGFGRVAREDEKNNGAGNVHRYIISSMLTSTPLNSVRNILSYSGRFESSDAGSSRNNTIALTNFAQLYIGISSYLNGSVAYTTTETGRDTTGLNANFGLNLIPNRKFSLNLTASGGRTDLSGGGEPEITNKSRRGNMAATYQPFENLYFSGSIDRSYTQSEIEGIAGGSTGGSTRITTRNFGTSWTPFPGGAFQLALVYSESYLVEREEKNRTFSPSINWYITRWATLTTSYTVTDVSTPLHDEITKNFNSNLLIIF